VKTVVNVKNDLTPKQRQELSDKIEKLMQQYGRFSLENMYFAGVIDGMNNIYKLINEIDDDYNSAD